jgi:hypothetical protein
MNIGPTPFWASVLAAVFGGITLIGMIGFAFLAAIKPSAVCDGFTPLAAVFALGVALSAGFIGGAASLTSSLNDIAKRAAVAFSAGGGIAVLFIAFWVFQHFKPEGCSQKTTELARQVTELEGAIKEKGKEVENFKNELQKFKKMTIVIPQRDLPFLPKDKISIQYYDRYGELQHATAQGSAFELSLDEVLTSGQIFVGYRLEAVPAERQNQHRPESIPIDKFSYAMSERTLRLWLLEPK